VKAPEHSLRSRLVGTYVAALVLALVVFAAIAVTLIDRALRSSLDARLATQAAAAAALIDVAHGSVSLDRDDRGQFLSLLGVETDGVLLSPSGRLLLSTVVRPPAALVHLPTGRAHFITVGTDDAAVRAFILPLRAAGKRVGSIIVWRSNDWIAQTDLGAGVAFGAAALVIAVIALFAGSRVTRRALADAFERQRRFTADASHELRAPLAVIRAEADLALHRERDPQEYRAALAAIAEEADRMELLIGDLLSAARADARRAPRRRIDLGETVRCVCARLSSTAAAKEACVTVRGRKPAYVTADAYALERALLAIAHNALRYTPRGGRVTMSVAQNGGTVDLDIDDDGPGFTQPALEHALERFWRDDAARAPDGTGLGLAIAKSIVEGFDGTIALVNMPTGGARVRLRFPAA
jgi:signal transduction histidine kinase